MLLDTALGSPIGADQPALQRVRLWRDWLTGRPVLANPDPEGGAVLHLADLFAADGHPLLPFAVLVPADEGDAA